MAQPESILSRRIAGAIRARGGFVFKVHGGPTMMRGLPDLIGCYRGRFIGWESKMTKSDVPSPIQRYRHKQIREAGGLALVVRSIAEAMAVLDAIDKEWEDNG